MKIPTDLRGIASWYASPSGVFLIGTLVLLGFGLTTSNGVVSWAAVVALAIFLPYRSVRERRQTTALGRKLEVPVFGLIGRTNELEAKAEATQTALKLLNTRVADIRAWRRSREPIDERVLAAVTMTMGSSYLPFNRRIDDAALPSIIDYWSGRLSLDIEPGYLRYLERKFVFLEGICEGRTATTSTDIAIRALAARSVAAADRRLEVLEIGSLFGLGAFSVYLGAAPFSRECVLTLIDPLEGYYGSDRTDPATGLPVTEAVLQTNRARLAIPAEQVRLLKGYSTDEQVLAQLDGQEFDLIVIDGDHSYDGLRQDFELYADRVRAGGLLIVDDYGSSDWPDVRRYADSTIMTDDRFATVGTQSRTAIFRRVETNASPDGSQPRTSVS